MNFYTFYNPVRKKRGKTFSTTWLVMKMVIFLISALALQVSASTSFAQKVTLNEKDASLRKVFNDLKKQTGYIFLYEDQTLDNTSPVTLSVSNTELKDVLDRCFQDQDLEYTIAGKIVAIKRKDPSMLEKLKSKVAEILAPPGTITGRVINQQGEPLSNATVLIKRIKSGIITEADGRFTLNNVNSTDTLLISFIGYKTFVQPVGVKTYFMIQLEEATNGLDEVKIQPYGITTQRLTTGDIGRVTAKEIEQQPVMNPLLALEGKVAGLDVSQINGFASAPVKVEIRGRASVNSSFTSDPLYVIDGVPLTVLEINSGSTTNYKNGSSGFIQSGINNPAKGQSPLFSINPDDIESIEILKDADATAIYGSRGANGVILITTKKGKAGKIHLDVHVDEGIDKVTNYWQMMNTQQYIQMREEAYKNDGLVPTVANGAYDLLQWNTNSYTDWQKAIYGNMGRTINAQTNLSGGNEQTTFRIGAGYNHTVNILTVSGADQRGSFSFNVNHHSVDNRFTVSLTGQYSFTQSDMISFPTTAAILPPDAPPIFDASGNLNWAGWGAQNSSARSAFPFAGLLQPYTGKTNFLNSNLVLSYQIIKGLKFSTNVGYSNTQANQTSYQPIASKDPLSSSLTGSSFFGYTTNQNWIIEPQATYDVLLGKGKLNALIGGSMQETTTSGLYTSGSGFTNDALLSSLSNATSISDNNNFGEYRYAALFGRLTYNLQDEYIVNVNVRRDGSSRFGPGKQFGDFGSVGAAWIFTEENWAKESLQFLSLGKFRSSYGTTGSDQVGDYQYLSRWGSSSAYPIYNGVAALAPTQFANPNFQWQVNKKLELAVDLGFLKDWVTVSADYYRDRTGNQLVSYPTPELSGFTSVVANLPALVQNSGLEATVNSKIIDTKDIHWSFSGNISINRNKLLAFPDINLTTYASQLIVGQPLNIVQVLHYIGVNPLTGVYTYFDKNHDGNITDAPGSVKTDTYPVDLNPKFFGGFGTNFSYKSLQLSLFFNYKKQIGLNALYTGYYQGTAHNQPSDVLGNVWQQPGDAAMFGRFSTSSQSNLSLSDGVYTDASFIRLSNLSLSYGLPVAYIKKIGLQSCRIFVNANNLFLITDYKGLDPETQNFGGMPPAKTIVVGLSLNF